MEDFVGIEHFSNLPWHDAKLLGFQVAREGSVATDDVVCIVEFRVGIDDCRRAQLAFRNCTILKIDLDLDGKRVCADSISFATVAHNSELRKELESDQLRNERQPLGKYHHFRIRLIPPGGEINVFAETCDLVWQDKHVRTAI